MDLSFVAIPLFVGEYRRLYKKGKLDYVVSDNKNPTNHPIYEIQEDMGSCMLHLDGDSTGTLQVETYHTVQYNIDVQDCLWKM